MTQFALVKANKSSPHLQPIDELKDDFLLGIVGKLFPGSSDDEIFIIYVDGMDIDALMLDAQKQMIESTKFEGTLLCNVIDKVAQTSDEIIFWYGSDYDGLDYIYDVPALLSKLGEAVSDSACELYIHYKKAK